MDEILIGVGAFGVGVAVGWVMREDEMEPVEFYHVPESVC